MVRPDLLESCVQPNYIASRSILHDAEQYPDPEAFKPERWLMEDKDIEGGYRLNPDVPDPTCSFGFGRRCV